MQDYIVQIAIGIVASLIAGLLLLLLHRINRLPGFASRVNAFKNDLRSQVASMPFIYMSFESLVLKDYVDIEARTVDPRTLQRTPISPYAHLDFDKSLQHSRRVLFLGKAGTGKTTFQRYAILQLLEKKTEHRFIMKDEDVIPIYIPLKVIDNGRSNPILSYLLESNSLFNYGPRGRERLVKMARNRGLALFLDGYDEIPAWKGKVNPVRNELERLLFPDPVRIVSDDYKDYISFPNDNLDNQDVYNALSHCRIWLSSRPEFLELNPIGCIGTDNFANAYSLKVIEFLGVGGNRLALANRIFDKYKRNQPRAEEELNGKQFIADIHASSDKKLIELSYNPLFLTTMCYVYAEKTLRNASDKLAWSKSLEQVITDCIDMLVVDLDELKARELPKMQKNALVKLRTRHRKLKKKFIRYFAAQLYLKNVPVFMLSDLKSYIKTFLASEPQSDSVREILSDLNQDVKRKPNFALQLIYSGVFITVQKEGKTHYYDFPHRRFREVLAAQSFATAQSYLSFLAAADQTQFSELVQYMRSSRAFNYQDLHDNAIKSIFQRALSSALDRQLLDISKRFVEFAPRDFDYRKYVEEFLSAALRLENPRFRLTRNLIRVLDSTSPVVSEAEALVTGDTTMVDTNRFSLALQVLLHLNPALLMAVGTRKIESDHDVNDVQWQMIVHFLYSHHSGELLTYVDKLLGHAGVRRQLWYECARHYSRDNSSLHALKRVWRSLKIENKIECMAVFYGLNRGSMADVVSTLYLGSHSDLIAVLSHSNVRHDVLKTLSNGARKRGNAHLVTEKGLEQAITWATEFTVIKEQRGKSTARSKTKKDGPATKLQLQVSTRELLRAKLEQTGRTLLGAIHFNDRVIKDSVKSVFENVEMKSLLAKELETQKEVERLRIKFVDDLSKSSQVSLQSIKQTAQVIEELDFTPVKPHLHFV